MPDTAAARETSLSDRRSETRTRAIRRPRSSPRSTRANLARAGLEAFAAHGFEGASTRDIANTAGVPQGLVRHHFGSKEGLFRAVVTDGVTALLEQLDAEAEREPLTVSTWVRCMPQHVQLLRVGAHALLGPGALRDFTLGQAAPVWERLRALQRRAEGSSATDDRLVMWLGASLALPMFASAIEPEDRDPLRQRNTLHAWLTERAPSAPSGPFSLRAARSRLRG